MALSNDLISQFAKIVNSDKKNTNTESTVYGTVVEYDNKKYVKIDGSDQITPVSTTTDMEVGERVTVQIKNHTATVTGNISSPSARTDTVKEVEKKVEEEATKITEFEIAIGKKVDTEQLNAESARIDSLVSDNVIIRDKLEAAEAEIDDLTAENVEISGKLTAAEAEIDDISAKMLTAEVAKITYAEINDLEASVADIRKLEADYLTVNNKLVANDASIKDLEAKKLTAEQADILYANIDFANIDMAAVEKLFADSGIIEDLVVSEGKITGELVGVTIKGDIIEGGTVIADKLVIKGSDGLYYKLNTNGESVETAQTEYNSLNGSIITAKSITATKIAVEDLVAFGATIGGFHITDSSLYSGAKASVGNTTTGIYLDKTGQIAFGDGNSYIKYYKDGDIWKLAIAADNVTIGSSKKTVETYVKEEVQAKVDNLELKDGEDATVLRIDSSRGTVFKNSGVSTVLNVVIYRGALRITDINTLRSVYGNGAYLEWSWQRMNESTFGVISASDSRISQNGFAFTLSPEDVDAKATFSCTLHV